MYWLYWLGTLIEVRFGLKTYLTLFFVSAIASVLIPLLVPQAGLLGLQGLKGGAVVGMSGVVYAVIGFGWCKMRMQPSVGLLIPPFILINDKYNLRDAKRNTASHRWGMRDCHC